MLFKVNNSWKDDKISFKDHVLVVPAISVGNVGQLTLDILITTTQAKEVGAIYDESLLPLVGNDPYTSSTQTCKLSSCVNVYLDAERKMVFIQQRATFVKGKRKQFRAKLISWIKENEFSQIYLVGSTYSHMRTDQQIDGTQFRYLATEKAKSLVECESRGVELEDTADEYGRMGKRLTGAGIAKTLYDDCCAEKLPLVELLMFCSDGDNTPDALRMAEFANKWLNIVNGETVATTISDLKKVWKIPLSWRLNFGSTYNHLIY